MNISPLSDRASPNIFPDSAAGLCVLLMVSFAVRKLFSLTWSQLLVFNLDFLALGDVSKELFLRPVSRSLSPLFSPGSLVVGGLTFRSSVHFEFIPVCGMREWPRFFCLFSLVSAKFPKPFDEETVFTPSHTLASSGRLPVLVVLTAHRTLDENGTSFCKYSFIGTRP